MLKFNTNCGTVTTLKSTTILNVALILTATLTLKGIFRDFCLIQAPCFCETVTPIDTYLFKKLNAQNPVGYDFTMARYVE